MAAYGSNGCTHVMGLVNRVSEGMHAFLPELTNNVIRRVIGY